MTPVIEKTLNDRLERLAKVRGDTPDALLAEAVAQYVEREEARALLRAEARDAWADYAATGRHATGAAVDAWLARLEAGETASPPAVAPPR